ncbi:MAG: peroxiredoxin [Prevotella sp.]|nr:peroxiredoxin [Prevotellaceae bacterium]MDY4891126.1 peroxiredoxin [Prevotella sp.]MDY5249821.1 peroxiredoxin [Prevotella sp.]
MNIGDRIPEVLGIDQDGHEIKSSDYKGKKIVLYSYPKANTSGCTAEACSLQAHKAELAAAGYEIIGVSKDKQALQKKFAEAQGLEFPLIADTETTLLQTLGCWGEKVACGRRTIGTLRTTYLVNEEGIIEKIFSPKEIKTYKNDMYKLMIESGCI